MPIKTIFLDRDGVINKEKNYLYKIDEFEFIDGIFDSCKYFLKLGYKLVIITNQSGIARGFYTEKEYNILSKWMINQFLEQKIKILDIFHCPHDQNAECSCRKPKPGMFLSAQKKHNINLSASWMIGDKEIDITSANAAGINQTILLRSGHKIDETCSKASFIENTILGTLKIITN
jgi:D-glycero-D-manno-heptose 1,7-bisphosphate phosphatase